jgi:hypothetical protein
VLPWLGIAATSIAAGKARFAGESEMTEAGIGSDPAAIFAARKLSTMAAGKARIW